MKLALHIFGKDVRHLWPQIAIVLLLAAGYVAGQVRPNDALRWLSDPLGVLLPAAYAWLIVTLMHQEAVPGGRQFWLTRPYPRRSLLAAKALFVLLFVSATMIAKDCVIVTALGFPILPNLTGLVLRQFAWTAWVVLPALAAGAVTRNLQEVGLVGAGVALVYALQTIVQGILGRASFWPGIEWIRDYFGMVLLWASCLAIVLWQYRRRETGTARAAAAFVAVLVVAGLPLLPWGAGFAVQMLARRPRGDWTNSQVAPDLTRARRAAPAGRIPLWPTLELPVKLTGLPGGMTLVPDGARFEIVSGARTVWRSGWRQGWYGTRIERFRSLEVYMDERSYRRLENQRVTIRLSVGFTLLEDEPPIRVPADQRVFFIEGSRCERVSPENQHQLIWCHAALRAVPRALMEFGTPGAEATISQTGTWSYAPYEAVLDQSPVSTTVVAPFPNQQSAADPNAPPPPPDAPITVTIQRPVAHFRRDLVFPNVRLADYLVSPRRARLQVVRLGR